MAAAVWANSFDITDSRELRTLATSTWRRVYDKSKGYSRTLLGRRRWGLVARGERLLAQFIDDPLQHCRSFILTVLLDKFGGNPTLSADDRAV